jgi:hypothetical protein
VKQLAFLAVLSAAVLAAAPRAQQPQQARTVIVYKSPT